VKRVTINLTDSEMEDMEKMAGLRKSSSPSILVKGYILKEIEQYKNPDKFKNEVEIQNLRNQIEEFKRRLEEKNKTDVKYADGLDSAAEMLIMVLDPPLQKWIAEVSEHVLHLPMWQLIAGHLRLAYDRGEITGPAFDPSWENIQLNRDLKEKGKPVCPNCLETFEPMKLKQIYCCNNCSAGKPSGKFKTVVLK